MLISLPSAVGLYILSFPIIHILFERGAFVAEDTFYTSKVLSIFALGLPAYILIKILVTCFFAREDTKTPLYVSIVSVIVNIVLSILLISSMREMGIALATAISAWANILMLFIIFCKKHNFFLDTKLIKNIMKILIATLLMILGCYFLNALIFENIEDLNSLLKITNLLIIIIFCKIIYLAMIFMLKVISLQDLKDYIKK